MTRNAPAPYPDSRIEVEVQVINVIDAVNFGYDRFAAGIHEYQVGFQVCFAAAV